MYLCADDTIPVPGNDSGDRTDTIFFQKSSDDTINSLVNILQILGIDVSYGEDGETIFSMVKQSLHSIITSLSSGNTEGFLDIPLIQETLSYFGISPGDVVVNPENLTGEIEAVSYYNRKSEGADGV